MRRFLPRPLPGTILGLVALIAATAGISTAANDDNRQDLQVVRGHVSRVSGQSVKLCASGGTCDVGQSIAKCPAGAVVLGGGWNGEITPPVSATEGYNYALSARTWEVTMVNNAILAARFHAVATCLRAPKGNAAADTGGGTSLTAEERLQAAKDLAAVKRGLRK